MNREEALDYLVKNLDEWPESFTDTDGTNLYEWEWYGDESGCRLIADNERLSNIKYIHWIDAREAIIKPDQPTFEQNPNYKQKDGGDLIDKWAVKYTRDEFRAVMRAQVDKYYDRYGDKDSFVSESRKAADYANRLHLQEVKWAAEDNEVSE